MRYDKRHPELKKAIAAFVDGGAGGVGGSGGRAGCGGDRRCDYQHGDGRSGQNGQPGRPGRVVFQAVGPAELFVGTGIPLQ